MARQAGQPIIGEPDERAQGAKTPGAIRSFVAQTLAIWQIVHTRLLNSLHSSTTYARANMLAFGTIAVIGHPLYYFIWTEFYPQQYESAWLRGFSVLVSLPMLFESKLARNAFWRTKLSWYVFFLLLYLLPFFFVYMSLMNGFSPAWALSTMAACMLLVILVVDWLMTFILAATGSILAWVAFLLVDGNYQSSGLPLQALLPIYLFGLVAGSVFNYRTELVTREKLAAITSAVGTMAHELRTPLLGIRSGALGLQNYLPALLEAYDLARAHNLPIQPIRKAHYHQIHAVLDRIGAETEYASVILEMLLVNSNRSTIDVSDFRPVSINRCIDTALERFPFHPARERQCVHWDNSSDFKFQGSELLMVHVLFNLLKNALYYLKQVDDGRIYIWTQRRRSGVCQLHFRDTGPGIERHVLPRIFERFYSGMPRGSGTGIGLAFVHLVMDSFNGAIQCRSVVGEYTEFVMTFPTLDDDGKH